METKQSIRLRCRAKRDAISTVRRYKAGQCTAAALPSYAWYRSAEVIYTYLSFGSEFDTELLIQKAWKDGKTVAAPRMGDDHTIVFYQIDSDTIFEINSYGIREPKEKTTVITAPGVMLVPGLGFDLAGTRLGYGGGYYDRYLEAQKKHITVIALCFASQIESKLPCDAHDVRMDGILTEEGYQLCLNK